MNKEIIQEISGELNIKNSQIEAVLKLLSEGNTIPFIARYRKEMTGSLDEEQIRRINEYYEYQTNLLKRKEDVIRLIDEKGLLTDELKLAIMNSKKLVEVEDLYRPFKEKKKTKATEAINAGLEGLAKKIMKNVKEPYKVSEEFINDKVKSVDDAIIGAKYIIAEWFSDDAKIRQRLRKEMMMRGIINCKLKKNAVDDEKVYENYYNYQENIKTIKPHRILAINRGEKENVLSVSISINDEVLKEYMQYRYVNYSDENKKIIFEAIDDAYKRLIYPSVEREIRAELKEIGDASAIENFSLNLEHLLLTPPIKMKTVIGFDPAFRTGCKLAVLDKTGKLLDIAVIYPTEPHNKIDESEKILLALIQKYDVDIIAIGNGTASRESEMFIANTIKKCPKKVEYIIVSEAGASVYSASKEAINEFPDLTVEKRSAISIGRRLQDSLAELVKIDPKSIGVGQYQHDVSAKNLDESLNFVVTKVVNQVGVNVNTASRAILGYISGLNKKCIDAIIAFRDKLGKINSREEIKDIKGITPKVYEQAIGFLRIEEGTNPLDRTSIHPENYELVSKILHDAELNIKNLGTPEFNNKVRELKLDELKEKYKTSTILLNDIIECLLKPNRDPRDEMQKPILKSGILHIEDLKIGDKLSGTVRNVIDFGAFVDIGLHDDGLIHISKMSNNYIKHPSEVLSVGDIIDCYVIDIDIPKKKISLSLLENKK